MNKLKLWAMAALVAGTAACNNSPYKGYEKTETGLLYKFYLKNSETQKPVVGDFAHMEISYFSDNDSLLFSSQKYGSKFVIRLDEPTYKGDIMEGIAMMATGDSASFLVTADSFYVHNVGGMLPNEITPGSKIRFEVKLEKVQTTEELENEKRESARIQSEKEQETIAAYLKENNITATPSASGLIIIEKTKGNGKKPQNGQIVKVNYTGKLLNGQVFDTSIEADAKAAGVYNPQRPYKPIEFPLGAGQVIRGWDEGLAQLSIGSKATFIIPSAIAYGPQDMGIIPPHSTLIFEVELVGIN
jgi:FKBP-type peptidyl-prolyl cis-trans isomerase FkpA